MIEYKPTILSEFENEFHAEIIKWVEGKMPDIPNLSIFDISIDHSFFASVVADRVQASRLVVGRWFEGQKIPDSLNIETYDMNFDPEQNYGLNGCGGSKFSVIILREVLHKVKEDMQKFFMALKPILKDDGEVIVLTRPKNPPVPLPDNGIDRWRKTAPTREDILEAAADAGYKHDCYAVSCPVKVPKAAWGAYLRGRFIAALHENSRCTDREIDEFISNKPSPFFEFEEKILICVLKPKDN